MYGFFQVPDTVFCPNSQPVQLLLFHFVLSLHTTDILTSRSVRFLYTSSIFVCSELPFVPFVQGKRPRENTPNGSFCLIHFIKSILHVLQLYICGLFSVPHRVFPLLIMAFSLSSKTIPFMSEVLK